MNTASITSDKPLFIKAVEIVQSNGMKVVCHLGGFHLLMNFLGAIESIMAGSGLSQALESCYGPVTLTHIMIGKAYAKAIRGHFLAESALMVLLMDHFFATRVNVPPLGTVDLTELKKVYADVVNHSIQFDDCSMPGCIQSLQDQLCAFKRFFSWLFHVRYIYIYIYTETLCS